MSLGRKSQIKIYEKYWEIIENLAKVNQSNTSRVSDFVRDFLTLENKKIPNKRKVYQEFKQKYPTSTIDELEHNLGKLKKFVKHYNRLLNPGNEPDVDIRLHLSYINRLEINVSYPFLMQVYDDYENQILDKNDFISILELIQSFTWRRFIVGLPTNALNKIFMTLYSDINQDNYLESLEFALLKKKASQRFPNNNEVLNILKEKDVYGIKSKNRVYFLDRLENYNNNERVEVNNNSKITIEHIFPKNPDDEWLDVLKEDEYNTIKDNYLNSIANLTLSGNNGQLGNKIFSKKKEMNKDGGEQGYIFSRLWLNRFLSKIDNWGLKELEERFEIITERFLSIWKYPELPTIQEKENEINIFDIDDTTGKKLDYVIFFDQKFVFHTISELYLHIIQTLLEMQPETFFSTDLGKRLQMEKNADNMRRGIPLNDTYFIETNISSAQKISRIKYALGIFGVEDELFVKWDD